MSAHCASCALRGPACGGCCLSRRGFVSATTGLIGALGLASWRPAAARPLRDVSEVIPPEALRPKPLVRMIAAVIRFKPPYWLGWPGTSYDLEGWRATYRELSERAARRNGIQLECIDEPIESDAAVASLADRIRAEHPDGVLVTLQHMGVWHWAERLADAGAPLVVFAPVGTAFTGHVDAISRRRGVRVLSTLDFDAVEQSMRMIVAKRMFEESRILVVAGDRRRETVLPLLGTKVRYTPRRVFEERFAAMPITPEVRQFVETARQRAVKIVEPTLDDLHNAGRVYVTAKQLLAEEQSNALSMDCLGMVAARKAPTPPCLAWSTLQDVGVTGGCEADLFAAVSLMMTSYLFRRPGFINDPVPETAHNRLITAHCVSGTRLNGFDQPAEPLILRSHSESNLGVSTQVLWKPGQKVTLLRFTGPSKILVDTGTVAENIDTPPAGGCRTNFSIDMDRIEDCRDVLGFHQVVFYGDWRRELQAFAQLYGLDVTHSPERARTA